MSRKQFGAEVLVLLGLLLLMLYLPVVMGGEPNSARSVLLFAVGWIIVRTIALSAAALWRRRRAT